MAQLRLLDFSGVPKVNLPSMSNLENLSHLLLQGCSNINTVLDLDKLVKLEVLALSGTAVRDLTSLTALNNLRSLFLRNCSELLSLPNLGSLGHLVGNSLSDSFKQLKYLSLDACPMLVSIFHQPCLLQKAPLLLENLETIRIKFCDNVEFLLEENAGVEIDLPRLHELHLWRLPKFSSSIKSWTTMQTCNIKECPMLGQL